MSLELGRGDTWAIFSECRALRTQKPLYIGTQTELRDGEDLGTLRRPYKSDLRNFLASLQPNWENVYAAAQYRKDWRSLEDALSASGGTGGSKV